MVAAEQMKSSIRTHDKNQREQFSTIALEIRGLVDDAKVKDYERVVPFTPELEHLDQMTSVC